MEKGAAKGCRAARWRSHTAVWVWKTKLGMVGIFQQIPLWFIVLYDFAHRALVCPHWNCGLFKILEKVVKKTPLSVSAAFLFPRNFFRHSNAVLTEGRIATWTHEHWPWQITENKETPKKIRDYLLHSSFDENTPCQKVKTVTKRALKKNPCRRNFCKANFAETSILKQRTSNCQHCKAPAWGIFQLVVVLHS